jgi:hypothetical protein
MNTFGGAKYTRVPKNAPMTVYENHKILIYRIFKSS